MITRQKQPRPANHRVARIIGAALCSCLIGVGCTQITKLTTGDKRTKPTSGAQRGENPIESGVTIGDLPGVVKTIELTADYQTRPVDVLIIGDGVYTTGEVQQRLNDALPVLSAHMWNLAITVGSLHVAVLDRELFDDNGSGQPGTAENPSTTTPIVGAKSPKVAVLNAEGMSATDFTDALVERMGMIGQRGGGPQSESVLLKAVSEAAKPDGGTLPGLMRADAYWAILVLNGTINSADPVGVDDIVELMKSHTAGWGVSTLGIDDKDCPVVDSNPPQSTNPEKALQRNSALKLAKLSGGVIGSYCADRAYSRFADDFVTKGTGTEYFSVEMPAPIKAINKISVGSSEVKQFRFIPGSKTLEVSTRIKSGDKFSVDAVLIDPNGTVVVGTDTTDKVPTAQETSLSPEETAFLQDVQPALSRACSGCHFGRPYDSSGGFASASANKDEIARRLQLPTSDVQYMPQNNGTISKDDKAAILSWATK